MRLKTIRTFFIGLLLLSGTIQAQNDTGFEGFLYGGQEDAELLVDSYMSPFLKGMGMGFNSGWYNTAQPHKTLGFDITFSTNFAYVPTEQQTFLFDADDYNYTSLVNASNPNLPTIAGGGTNAELLVSTDTLGFPLELARYGAPDGVFSIDSYDGAFTNTVPSPIIQAGIGIVKGTELKIRWMPTITQDEFSFKYFGIGGLHSISQWIPVFKELPIDISAFVGYTQIDAKYAIPPGSIDGENQRANFKVNTFSYQVLASAHISVITGYIGLGMDSYNTNLSMTGTYEVYPGLPGGTLTDPINIERSGNNNFRTTFGVRLKLAIVTLHADYTLREYNTLSMGLGFSYR
jgi:hypothetical protein